MNKPENFSAFPNVGDGARWDGMTLRDYFAAKAMQSYVNIYGALNGGPNDDQLASYAYNTADAMLKARGE
jgi:hypothetical protein